ncbi:hypothetical protein D5085_12035 [Ectothiorhodospiraceae bacterium BW-2]|nr:hypothetical protein D5085_12035 [Ectothiorhodospiraceae bacterium BW-2]
MKMGTGVSTQGETEAAIAEIVAQLEQRGGDSVDLLICYYTENHAPARLQQVLTQLYPKSQIHGCSTCQGVMTEQGYFSEQGSAIAVLAISDPEGSYGSALVPMADGGELGGRQAIEAAIAGAEREGESPELVWLSATPGCEESVIMGIQQVIGDQTPIAGGSAADNSVAGGWSLFNQQQQERQGVLVTAFYPSVELSFAFHSGYYPTAFRGVVTRSSGRTIWEIDHQCAAAVYNRWIDHRLDEVIAQGGGSILSQTTLFPLGRVGGDGSQRYKLSHPESITAAGGLALFTDMSEGEELILMEGSSESLIHRAGRVADEALTIADMAAEGSSGALVIYCAGCMLTVEAQMGEVVESIKSAIPAVPFLGAFTFGEQGCFIDAGNLHGNLMISIVIFGR